MVQKHQVTHCDMLLEFKVNITRKLVRNQINEILVLFIKDFKIFKDQSLGFYIQLNSKDLIQDTPSVLPLTPNQRSTFHRISVRIALHIYILKMHFIAAFCAMI